MFAYSQLYFTVIHQCCLVYAKPDKSTFGTAMHQ